MLAKVYTVKAMVFPVIMYGCESWPIKKVEHQKLMLSNCGAGEDSWSPLDSKEIKQISLQFSCSVVSDSATPWIAACQASLSITNFQSLLKLMSIESVMPSNHLILSCPLLLLPSIFPSIRVFSNESVLRIRWPKYWSFSNSPSNEYSGLISFRIDWFDLAVQGLSRVFSKPQKMLLLQNYQFFGTQFSL